MLDQAGGAERNTVHCALNHRRCRLAVIACALTFVALEGGEKVGIGIDPAAKRATLQVQAHGNDQGTKTEAGQSGAQQFLILIPG